MCGRSKSSDHFFMSSVNGILGQFPLISVCNECSDEYCIEKINCTCSVCKRKLPETCFKHFRTRFKKNGMRLRVNTNCRECSAKENVILSKIKRDNTAPAYLTPCPQCGKICYEKVEDIPEGVSGTNGPWQCDHDHTTKQFRGYLCKRCNTGTGLIGDNVEYFQNALSRLKEEEVYDN